MNLKSNSAFLFIALRAGLCVETCSSLLLQATEQSKVPAPEMSDFHVANICRTHTPEAMHPTALSAVDDKGVGSIPHASCFTRSCLCYNLSKSAVASLGFLHCLMPVSSQTLFGSALKALIPSSISSQVFLDNSKPQGMGSRKSSVIICR